jgi:FtsP/CotA-like multicopper oxidase with cupredoxin domain
MTAAIPPRRPRPLRTMADMGMDMPGMKGMDKAGAAMPGMDKPAAAMPGMEKPAATMPGMDKPAAAMPGMDKPVAAMPGMDMTPMGGPGVPGSPPVLHGPDTHGAGNSVVAMTARSKVAEPGSGFEGTESRVLVYADLKSLALFPDRREPEREVELHITGNMERYMFSFDGKKYSDAKTPIPFKYNERLRLVLVNDTMMEHPIHLHGMWMVLENGAAEYQPRKHTVNVKPAERLTVAITADAPGRWAMHCHLLLHMEMGMFRVVEVSPAVRETA